MFRIAVPLILIFVLLMIGVWYMSVSLAVMHNIVRISSASGPVEVQRGGKGPWLPASVGADLVKGDVLRTNSGSGVTLKWFDGTCLVLDANSLIRVEDFSLKREQTLTSRFELESGQAWMHVRSAYLHNPGSVFEVKTSQLTAQVQGTIFSVAADASGSSRVSVLNGRVHVTTTAGDADVSDGQQTLVTGTGAPATTPLSPADQTAWTEQSDVLKPLLTITLPKKDGQLILNTVATVEGGTEPDCTVTVNGQAVKPDGKGFFTTQVSLTSGENTITVVARSPQGLESTEKRTVKCKPPKG